MGALQFGGNRCRWVPVKERSRSLALVYSGMYTGSILGLALSPHMVEVLTWPSVFYIFGSLGIVWYLVWQAKAASTPAADSAISKDERAYIEQTSVIAVRPCAIAAHVTVSVERPAHAFLSVDVMIMIHCHGLLNPGCGIPWPRSTRHCPP